MLFDLHEYLKYVIQWNGERRRGELKQAWEWASQGEGFEGRGMWKEGEEQKEKKLFATVH